MMKIMTAMYTLRRGGAYDRFMMMIEALLEHRCEVHCLSLDPIPVNHPAYHNHIMVFPFSSKNGWVARTVALLFFPLYGLLTGWREKIDLFVSFGPLYAFLQAFPKWILRKSMVTFIRLDLSLGLERKDLLDPIMFLNKVIERIGLIFSDRIIAVNTGIRDEIIRVIGRRKAIDVRVLFNNVPNIEKATPEEVLQTRQQLGIPKGAKILVTGGVLTPRKNIEILIKSLSKLRMEDICLLIIGDSAQKGSFYYQNYNERMIKKLGLGKRVVITGWVGKERLWKILGATDLFVLPSTKEGMPNALLEALGVGLPCMGSNIPGIKDILRYEDLMFDPLEEESLLQKIQGFFSDRQFFDKVMRLCQERKGVFVFDWKERVFEMITKTPTSLIE